MLDIVASLNHIIDRALTFCSSDIHLETKTQGLIVKYRVDGVLTEDSVLPLEIATPLFSRLKVLIKGDMTRKNFPQEGRFFYEGMSGVVVDIRVVIIPTILGEKSTLRILHRNDLLRTLPQLGMPQDVYVQYKNMLNARHGLILISGSTGSGKTTTMYASLLEIKSQKLNIITIEDPVEYVVNDINQIQFDSENELTFASVLRYVLRMDPDVIFIGEIRDQQTAVLACSAALTGHLVVATVHANDSFSAVMRLYDMGVEPYMLAHALLGALYQNLVPVRCRFCSGVGCTQCNSRGVSGRVALFELMVMGPDLRELMLAPPYLERQLIEAAEKKFFKSHSQDARQRLIANELSRDDLYAAGIVLAQSE